MALAQQTIIIQNQSNDGYTKAPQNVRPFSTGICGCFEDCGGAVFACFLMPCYLCQLASRLDEGCCVPTCLNGGIMAMRTKLRTMYGIQGSITDDHTCITYCGPLAACQMDREMRHCGI